MRKLIRPALFWAARIGLVLSVVSWIVGQSYLALGAMPVGNNHFRIFCAEAGWVFIGWLRQSPLEFKIRRVNEWRVAEVELLDALIRAKYDRDHPFAPEFTGFGITAGSARGEGFYLAAHHWLIVTVFALFYGVLKWVYRKRPEVADE